MDTQLIATKQDLSQLSTLLREEAKEITDRQERLVQHTVDGYEAAKQSFQEVKEASKKLLEDKEHQLEAATHRHAVDMERVANDNTKLLESKELEVKALLDQKELLLDIIQTLKNSKADAEREADEWRKAFEVAKIVSNWTHVRAFDLTSSTHLYSGVKNKAKEYLYSHAAQVYDMVIEEEGAHNYGNVTKPVARKRKRQA